MDLAEALLRLLGFARDWSARMRGFTVLLCLPLIVVVVGDWRISVGNWRVRRRR
jgi:hypothetical protein